MWGRRNGIRAGKPVDQPEEAAEIPWVAMGSAVAEATMPASVGQGQTSSWTPCHERRVRIEGDVSGRNVVVRCPLCSQLWEVRFAPARAEDDLFALWLA